MRFFAFSAAILALAAPAFSFNNNQYTLYYNQFYDDGSTSLNDVACSNGPNGLITNGYHTFEDLPSFPRIAATSAVQGWGSIYCGTCWQLTYTNSQNISSSINVTAVNTDGNGNEDVVTTTLEAMDQLTHGQAKNLGSVKVTAVRVPNSGCGM